MKNKIARQFLGKEKTVIIKAKVSSISKEKVIKIKGRG